MRWGPYMKILVYVDASMHSLHAVETAAKIAKDVHASVTILGIGLRYTSGKSYTDKLEEESTIALRKAEDIMKKGAVSPRTMLLRDVTLLNAKDEIVNIIKEEGFDLVIIGSMALTGLKKLMFGGIDVALLDAVPCSVLAVRTSLED
jgi:nucleotide-binding universal stress UspA family protein